MGRRILHVIPAVAARYGGPSAAALGMCRALQARGIAVVVATTDADGPGRLRVRLGEPENVDGVPVVHFARRFSESFKWSPSLGRWLARHVGDFDLAHVHAVFSHSTLVAGRACRRSGVPYVIRPLGTLDPWSVGRHARRKQLLLTCGLRSVLRAASAMHYTSDEEGRLARGVMPFLPRGVTIPLGVDDEWFAREPQPAARRLVTYSRLDAKKGVDLVIRAFHALQGDERWRDWSLSIAGDGDPGYVDGLRRLAADGPGRGRITFAGWLAGAARLDLMERCGLFVLPSAQENFGLAAAQAMAAGLPVVVTPGVNLAAAIRDARAGWVASRDVGNLADVLASAMADAAERQARGLRARELAERFRWPAVAAALQQLYDDVTRQAAMGREDRSLTPASDRAGEPARR